MLKNEDRLSKPSAGRFFALPVGPCLARLLELEFEPPHYKKRIDVEFRNPKVDPVHGIPVAELHPRDAFVQYSFSDEFGIAYGKKIMTVAMQLLRELDAAEIPKTPTGTSVSFGVYAGPLQKLTITRRIRRSKSTKYRGSAKFSTAFRPKKTDRTEEVIGERSVA